MIITRTLVRISIVLFLGSAAAATANAQPTDAQIKRQLSGPKTISVTLGGPGKREWSTSYKKYIWSRSFTAKERTGDPKVNIIIRGSAAYDIVGGRYQFWRTFISTNEFEGIPNPTAKDVRDLIEKFGVQRFMGNAYHSRVIGEVESIGLSEEPRFTWHTVNSVSFNVIAVYRERTNDIGGNERVSQVFEIRLYRNNVSAEWHNMISSARDRTVLE